ncbi:heme-binding protein 1-like [Genypterus blacodes]|uniref:heme-binding protein 1-like n=1 Tax=Genypterus blacodes TaxID=154954 RepID=UPI003F76641F
MDGGACGGSRPASGLRLITMEELEAETKQNLEPNGGLDRDHERQQEEEAYDDDDYEENPGVEPETLLRFWQHVGKAHRVDVPADMSEPIQQLTVAVESSSRRETIPFKLLEQRETFVGVEYEKRLYDSACWACVTLSEDTYEQSICQGFMKIMRYICQQNTAGKYLGMTVPIVTVVGTDEAHTTMSRKVKMAFFLPHQFQEKPPLPTDPDITLETWSAIVVYSRAFTGLADETSILSEINALAELLDADVSYVSRSFIIAGYSSLATAHRHNEVWFLERR